MSELNDKHQKQRVWLNFVNHLPSKKSAGNSSTHLGANVNSIICKKALESQILIDKVLFILFLGCWYRNWKRSSGWTGESWLPLSSQCWWPWSLLSTFLSTKWCRTTDAWSRTPSTGCPAGKGLRTVPTQLSWAALLLEMQSYRLLTLHSLPLRTSFFNNWWETLRWRKTRLWQI